MSRVSHAPQVSSADWRPIPAGFPVTPFVDTHVEDGAIAHSTSNDASPTSRTSPSSLGGTKRTSSGTMKRPASSHGVASDYQPGHSRTNSAQSSTSRTGGLAAELKTKLTYAMLKVNNGWQRNTLDQIEQLAIQKASPTSATFPESVSRRAYASPHSSAPSMMRRVSRGSSDSDSYLGSPNTAVFSPVNGSNLRFAGKMSPPQQTNAWPSRPFPQNPYAAAAAAAAPRVIAAHSNLAAATSNPVLAPAADISSPSRSRRAEMPSYKPPNLPGSHRKQPSTSGAPRTPNQNPRTTLIRTPTEQARAEKDALDTLMFMSSPGNSVYYGHTGQGSHGQLSPLGTQVRKAAAFESKRPIQTTGQSKSNSSTGASPGGLARGYVQAHKPQEAVARILDEMEDEDSDNEGGHGPRAIQT
ncbi:MAG: hypothetical protein M1822_005143 [Bathelium mastoideum]|nr:MAG: hypothetical protein M1822_005143 [Bathelium mastoideum]